MKVTPESTQLGRRIRHHREQRDLNRPQLAEQMREAFFVKFSDDVVYRIERGMRHVSNAERDALAKILKADFSQPIPEEVEEAKVEAMLDDVLAPPEPGLAKVLGPRKGKKMVALPAERQVGFLPTGRTCNCIHTFEPDPFCTCCNYFGAQRPDWRNTYLLCEGCSRSLQEKRGHNYTEQARNAAREERKALIYEHE